ncbi:MAG: DUF5058 family protein [Clostridia bacterium]|nr:DUF5058 family protein [Clostridia bacterium]
MEFSVNHPLLFILVGIIIVAVLGQSVLFLVRALRRSKELGMDGNVIKKTVTSAILFTIAPAIAILVGVIALSKSLGIALPWLRLSVIGSLSYETVAAGSALGALGLDTATTVSDASDFVTVAFVMTFGIIVGLILVPLLTKKIQGGLIKMESKDKRWSEIFNNSMFLGMIAAFLGYVFCDVSNLFHGDTSCLVPPLVMVTSAVIMMICGVISKKYKVRWITDYALPLSLIVGMAMAIPYTNWLG